MNKDQFKQLIMEELIQYLEEEISNNSFDYTLTLQKHISKNWRIGSWQFHTDRYLGDWVWEDSIRDYTATATPFKDKSKGIPVEVYDTDGKLVHNKEYKFRTIGNPQVDLKEYEKLLKAILGKI